MGQLCRVGNPSTDGCSSALEVPRGSGAGCRWGDQAEDPVRPRASRSTRSQSLGSPPRRGAGGKGVQEKVSVPTMKLSGGARSGLGLGSYKTRSLDRARPAPPRPSPRPGATRGPLHTHLAGERGQRRRLAVHVQLRTRGAQQLSPRPRTLAAVRRGTGGLARGPGATGR